MSSAIDALLGHLPSTDEEYDSLDYHKIIYSQSQLACCPHVLRH